MFTLSRFFHIGACSSLIAMILLCICWEFFFSPDHPQGSWMVLKVIPLLLPLPGILQRNIYTMQWSCLLALPYLAEGIIRGLTDTDALSRTLAWSEVLFASTFLACALLYLYPFKRAAKQLARQAIQKAAQMAQHND